IACVAALAGVFWNHRQPKERPPVADTANSRHADSTEYSLTEADRKYIWDIEHVAFQLNQKVAPVFCGAIERADRAELLQFLADDYRGQVFAADAAETIRREFGEFRFQSQSKHSTRSV